MAKNLKLNIKNTQIAEAIKLDSLKEKLSKKKSSEEKAKEKAPAPTKTAKAKPIEKEEPQAEVPASTPRRARTKSVFAEGTTVGAKPAEEALASEKVIEEIEETKSKSSEELRREIFGEDIDLLKTGEKEKPTNLLAEPIAEPPSEPKTETKEIKPEPAPRKLTEPKRPEIRGSDRRQPSATVESPEKIKLGPTGKHIKDFLPLPKKAPEVKPRGAPTSQPSESARPTKGKPIKQKEGVFQTPTVEEDTAARKGKPSAFKEFKDVKPARKQEEKVFDARDRHGFRDSEEEQRWRKKKSSKRLTHAEEIAVVRPTSLKVRTPISIKDLAAEMKLKASQLISKLFLQGVIVTLNDLLDDETTIQLLGQEFGCDIQIDTSEEQRIRITDKTVREEISGTEASELVTRPPVVAFMGHVDHGKTSLIDSIRKSNRTASEAGAITQHIGAFRCQTPVGDITILDTPGHEAFSAMRARGADVTDIVVLVVAGDEGIKQQTVEAIQHAKGANVTIVVAINKSDKPNFNPDNVYRQLADQELLPEAWGGQILTVNCSAVTGAGIKELLETLALQAEVLELKANPSNRARGVVLESELHKGLGAVATVLVQNGTLKLGDSIVFESHWGRVKTMRDEFGKELEIAGPSTPVAITGLSDIPEAGQEFIVVKNEREARDIADVRRMQGMRQTFLAQQKKLTPENLLQQATPTMKKVLNIILRADVQGSLEALKTALLKIESDKAEVNIISMAVGEVSESDIQLASTSKAVVLGFHTKVEGHAEPLIKQWNVQVRLHDIIYHAIDDVKDLMKGLLDKIAQETNKGKAEVKAVFKSSQVGQIAGCMVIDGTIQRSNHIRVIRNAEVIAKTPISSLRRVKDDVREVSKGQECGIALQRFSDVQVGDILEAYEVTYITQEL